MSQNYDDKLLISLRRQYSKDETVAALSKSLREAEFKNGVLRSHVDELLDALKKIKAQLPAEPKATTCKICQKRGAKIKKLEAWIKRLQAANDELIQRLNDAL